MNYFIDLTLKLFLIANLACVLMIAFRWGNRLILCQGIFVAVGAYGTGYLFLNYKFPLLIAIIAGALLGAAGGSGLALLTTKLSNTSFTLVTFLLATAGMELIQNWDSVTGGTRGLANLFTSDLPTSISIKTLVAVILAVIFAGSFLLVRGFYKTQFSRGLRAMRDDLIGAELDGINTDRLKRAMLAYVGFVSALIGAVWALSLPRILPEYFGFSTFALLIILACILGWGEQPRHALYGSLIVLLLEEGTQHLPVSPGIKADVPILLIGVIYVITTMLKGAFSLQSFIAQVKNWSVSGVSK